MDYKKILEGVVDIINTTEKSDIGFANICTYIGENCPELKENEDEKIRKELIRAFKSFNSIKVWNGIERTDILAWLEKQGEHANFRNKIQIGDKVTRNEDGVLVNMSQLKRVAKPADKIEPKFKVGNLVVDGIDMIYQIKEIKGSRYLLQCYNSNDVIPVKISTIDNDCHLWTINDAKDGDVLVCPKYANDIIPNIFIFKNIATKDNDVFCYCSFLKTFMTGGYVANADPINTDFYPATKEQRDTLMKAIADAGYTFDFEKKELRKIEQKQKWSEDDEYVIERLFCLLNNEQENYPQLSCDFQEIQEFKDWLKSLKERALPQNIAYYNPYKEVVESIAEICKHYDKASHSGLRDFYDNVKVKCKDAKEYESLYPQSTWKPSDEQMEALQHYVFDFIDETGVYAKQLKELYEQLKAL